MGGVTRRVAINQNALLRQQGRSACRLSAPIDCGYDDYLEGRISDGVWTRKSAECETELATNAACSTTRRSHFDLWDGDVSVDLCGAAAIGGVS